MAFDGLKLAAANGIGEAEFRQLCRDNPGMYVLFPELAYDPSLSETDWLCREALVNVLTVRRVVVVPPNLLAAVRRMCEDHDSGNDVGGV